MSISVVFKRLSRWRFQKDRFLAIKVLRNDVFDTQLRASEVVLSQRIAKADPKHEGLRYVRTVQESFEVQGPYGKHLCLVYVLMRETLATFQRRLENERVPGILLKPLLVLLLTGLDYLHTRCHIIHTGTFVSKF
jgi:serine/threonine-protein kinase SRPK3